MTLTQAVTNVGWAARIAAYNKPDTFVGPTNLDYAPMHSAVIVMAYREGHPRATLALVKKQKTFTSATISGTFDFSP